LRYYLFALALLLTACKKEETQVITTDSTAAAVGRDTLVQSLPIGDTAPTSLSVDTAVSSVIERGQRLLPVDEANQDGSFAKFREQMIWAVESKNANDLKTMLDSNIRLSFGGSAGLADFRKMWKPQDKNSPLWMKLEWVLKHGGSFRNEGSNKMFWAPYVYSNWPDDGPEPFEYGAIVGSSVPVFERADPSSKTLTTLDHHFVEVIDGGHLKEKSPAFVKIQTPSGKTGYVRSTEIRSQLDYRAGFDKRSGKWKMTAFIAGD
jgi:hypothetical protein